MRSKSPWSRTRAGSGRGLARRAAARRVRWRSSPSPPARRCRRGARRRASGPSRTPASAASSVRSLLSPRWPMRNMRPLTLPRPVPSERSKRSWMSRRTRIGVDAGGRDHAGQHRRVRAGVGALDRQAPGIDRRRARLAPALVAREHRCQALAEQHVERFRGRRAGWCSASTASSRALFICDDLVPGPEGARQRRRLARLERLAATAR